MYRSILIYVFFQSAAIGDCLNLDSVGTINKFPRSALYWKKTWVFPRAELHPYPGDKRQSRLPQEGGNLLISDPVEMKELSRAESETGSLRRKALLLGRQLLSPHPTGFPSSHLRPQHRSAHSCVGPAFPPREGARYKQSLYPGKLSIPSLRQTEWVWQKFVSENEIIFFPVEFSSCFPPLLWAF